MTLMLLLTIVIVGIAWFAVGALSKAPYGTAERETKTGMALKQAKEAVLAYVAKQAAVSTELYPGRLPCPEVRSQVGTANEGFAGPFATGPIACDAVGRLPWKTLGVDQMRDGYEEPIWFAVPTGTWAWVNTDDVLTINPGSTNQLTYDGVPNAAVAVIIAPGALVNSTGSGTPPSGCTAVNQYSASNRYTAPLSAPNFLECGNATGSYTSVGTSPWSNDLTISITAAEVMDAIAGAV